MPADAASSPDRARRAVSLRTIDGACNVNRDDLVVVEEPLEIRLAVGAAPPEPLMVTMRTPGRPTDFELALGLLWAEGVWTDTVFRPTVGYCLDPDLSAEQHYNVVTVTLPDGSLFDRTRLARSFAATSACGVCGKTTLDQLALEDRSAIDPESGPRISRTQLYALPDRLRAAQGVFRDTGGLHAAGLFDADGCLLAAREDVGRHNAVDKLVGWALEQRLLPLRDVVLVVSGRAGYEILQKALAAGIPIVASVSAPTSLAVDLAERFGLTLVGFLREQRANVYAGGGRIT